MQVFRSGTIRIFKQIAGGGREQVAKGHMTTVFTRLDENSQLQSSLLTDEIREKITEAPTSVLARPNNL
jgi:hypothetical protein